MVRTSVTSSYLATLPPDHPDFNLPMHDPTSRPHVRPEPPLTSQRASVNEELEEIRASAHFRYSRDLPAVPEPTPPPPPPAMYNPKGKGRAYPVQAPQPATPHALDHALRSSFVRHTPRVTDLFAQLRARPVTPDITQAIAREMKVPASIAAIEAQREARLHFLAQQPASALESALLKQRRNIVSTASSNAEDDWEPLTPRASASALPQPAQPHPESRPARPPPPPPRALTPPRSKEPESLQLPQRRASLRPAPPPHAPPPPRQRESNRRFTLVEDELFEPSTTPRPRAPTRQPSSYHADDPKLAPVSTGPANVPRQLERVETTSRTALPSSSTSSTGTLTRRNPSQKGSSSSKRALTKSHSATVSETADQMITSGDLPPVTDDKYAVAAIPSSQYGRDHPPRTYANFDLKPGEDDSELFEATLLLADEILRVTPSSKHFAYNSPVMSYRNPSFILEKLNIPTFFTDPIASLDHRLINELNAIPHLYDIKCKSGTMKWPALHNLLIRWCRDHRDREQTFDKLFAPILLTFLFVAIYWHDPPTMAKKSMIMNGPLPGHRFTDKDLENCLGPVFTLVPERLSAFLGLTKQERFFYLE